MLTELQTVDFSKYPNADTTMSAGNYFNALTPPSSNEDSPQSMLYNASPSSSSVSPTHNMIFQPNNYGLFGMSLNPGSGPQLKILEEPLDKFRFRYKSEMTGTHGSLCGQSSDRTRKQTYPTVQLLNWEEPAIIRCSIYQINSNGENFKSHPHRLIKKQGRGEVDDPHDIEVNQETGFDCIFHNMGIIHTAKKNLMPELVRKFTKLKEEEIACKEGKHRKLTKKEEVEIRGLADTESKSINLNVVCLRFDAFRKQNDVLHSICPPVFSHWINNLKSALTGELKIVRMDHCTSPAEGGREIFLLVERVTKKNIKIRLYEMDDDGNIIWEDKGRFSDVDVHHQYAIVFKTPPYKDLDIKTQVKVFIELERPTDGARSETRDFTYTPSRNFAKPGTKRARTNYNSSYDTSVCSDELPTTIQNLSIENGIVATFPENEELTSDDLNNALLNINSEEFDRFYNQIMPDYSVVADSPVLRGGNSTFRDGDVLKAQKDVMDIRNLMRKWPANDKIIKMLRKQLHLDLESNPLHILIRENDEPSYVLLLKLIYYFKQNDLLKVRNEELETALHIAVQYGIQNAVSLLINCKADVAQSDKNENTALHLAVLHNASLPVFRLLLSVKEVDSFIDKENNEGNTALALAIDSKNLDAVKLLCASRANVNLKHMKSGQTPLRLAIEKEHLEIVRFLLKHPDIDPAVEDFNGINPMHVVFAKENPDLVAIVTDYMRHSGYSPMEVKREVDDFNDSPDDESEEKYAIKLERLQSEEVRQLYDKVKNFTPECLDSVSEVLDESGTWKDLAEKLDMGHWTRTVLVDAQSSPSKILLKVAIETNVATILEIRDFLLKLEETRAVELMDDMVREQVVALDDQVELS